ncbi:MAG: hypothetical protein OEY00_04245, partial [Gammaproteobacteria bacterium]|nr:hypothetical protein [Gammaproteobacteria bacterium]
MLKFLVLYLGSLILLSGCGGADSNGSHRFPVIEITPKSGDIILDIELAELTDVPASVPERFLADYRWGAYFDVDQDNKLSVGDLELEVRLHSSVPNSYVRDRFEFFLSEVTEVNDSYSQQTARDKGEAIPSGNSLIIQANISRDALYEKLGYDIPVYFYAYAWIEESGSIDDMPFTGIVAGDT